MTQEETARGALSGLKVIDLTRVLAGPFCTQILADHGADVLKVESPEGDETRRWGPPFVGDASAYFMNVNRNKRGIILNLREQEGRDALTGLLEGADVLVENFKPGTLDKWGFGRNALEQRYPRLVHCCISGFGETGPYGGMPGYDAAIQAMSGLMSINGEPDGPPLRIGAPVVDMVTGLNAAIGILMALHERSSSGKGQYVDAALFDGALSILHPYSANFLYTGKIPERTGSAHPNITPYDTFATGDGPIFLAVGSDQQFRKLCEMIARPDLAKDERFTSNASRTRHRAALKRELEAALAAFRVEPLAEELIRAGVPCAPVLNLQQALYHPQAKHRNMVWEEGEYRGVGNPIRLSRTPARFRRPPPELGEG
ncbi:MAG: CoA transferase [Methyloligellaceae bacterium]